MAWSLLGFWGFGVKFPVGHLLELNEGNAFSSYVSFFFFSPANICGTHVLELALYSLSLSLSFGHLDTGTLVKPPKWSQCCYFNPSLSRCVAMFKVHYSSSRKRIIGNHASEAYVGQRPSCLTDYTSKWTPRNVIENI